MSYRASTAALALAAALGVTIGGPWAADEGRYPDWKGQWSAVSPPLGDPQSMKFDPARRAGPWQDAPLTPEYQKIFEDSMADQARGGLGNYATALCILGGMPRTMSALRQEYIITPETTYIVNDIDFIEVRRIFTDGRDWPEDGEVEPAYLGYSIGRWIDEDGDGRYDVLEVDTRGPFKGPRAYDHTGLPLHFDNQSAFKERFYIDKTEPNILHDEITVFDHALTRPWSVDKTFIRNPNPRPNWPESNCSEGNVNIVIGNQNYWLSADKLLMPTKKGQAAPDLKYFEPTQPPK